MKAAVCEDEKIYADKLKKAAEDFFAKRGNTAEITVYPDGAPLLADIDKGVSYSMIFLDIQLENSDGLDIAAEIRKRDKFVPLIFVTGLESRAAEGYAVSAFDYIVKSTMDTKLPAVLKRLAESLAADTITLETDTGDAVVLPIESILWIESEGRGTAVFTAEEKISARLPIGAAAELLPKDGFIGTFKSVFVRTEQIKKVGKDTLEMSNGYILPLSRRRRKAVLSAVMASVRRR